MKMDKRKQQVLMALIQDYISTAEPVGSRTIARKYKLGVSPATIRNEMADLEEMGLIEQPHTSAGRVPSDQGYRFYVDNLMKREELSIEEENVIQKSYETKLKDVGNIIQRTGDMISQLTNYAAVVMTTHIGEVSFKHIQLVRMSEKRALVVLVTETGAVHHRMIDIPESISVADLETISSVLNKKLQGRTIGDIRTTLFNEIYFELTKQKQILNKALELVREGLTMESEDKIYLGGVFNILSQPEFNDVEKIKTLLSLLEQEALLSDMMSGFHQSNGITVRIGGELSNKQMRDCSMVIGNYSLGGNQIGSIGILGPTRMDYARAVTIVDYMTNNLCLVMRRLIRGRSK
ncbi:MAG: heat-inducible transcriptional repressor HrcA [Clostridiales bacterium]|nr:heat-inducible transcriptional repressor HrcA [Clostridiales bacterium]MCF8021458.1 heat-inducible transcriptional repressor HrcA [Clostridiales bacterium]